MARGEFQIFPAQVLTLGLLVAYAFLVDVAQGR